MKTHPIKQYCDMAHIRQVEIAKRAGVSRSAITRYINNTRYPDPEIAQRLAMACDNYFIWFEILHPKYRDLFK